MRIRWMLALTAALGVCGLAGGQRAKAAEPTIEVRLQSVNVLLEKAEYIAGLAGKEDIIQGVKFILKNLQAEGKGIEGIDPKRPFGLYATVTDDPIQSPATVMVPIVDQERFLSMLKERLEITPEKVDGGALKIDLPEAAKNPVLSSVYLRFANDYMYVGRSAADLDPKGLIAPQAYFAQDEGALASVLVRGDRIPEKVKTLVIGQAELAIAEGRKKNAANENASEKALVDWLAGVGTSGLKSLLDDSKELRIRLAVDEKADEMSAEVVLTPKTGSPMARYIASLGNQMSLPAGIVSGQGAVGRAAVKIAMTPELKDGFGKVIDEVMADALKKVNEPEKEHIERALKVLAPTVKAGELDVAAALYGPDAKGRHTVLAALAVKDGKEIEKLARDFAVFAGGHVDITFDVEKIGNFSLHKAVLSHVPEEVEKIFGTKTVWVAVSDTHVAFSIEEDGTAIRAGLKAKPAPVPVLTAEVSLAKLLPLVAKDMKPEDVKALLKDVFGEGGSGGKDAVSITLTGGNQLTAKAKVKGKGVKVLVGANVFPKN